MSSLGWGGSKTTLSVDNLLEGLPELTESYYTHSYDFFTEKGYRFKSAKEKSTQGRVWGSTK